MNKLRRLSATLSLMAIILVAISTANAGILMSDLSGSKSDVDVCKEMDKEKVDSGVIVHLGGVIVHFVETVLGKNDTTECGVIIH